MSTGIHPKQIKGTYAGTLYDQLLSLDLDMVEADVTYEYDPATGLVTSETVTEPTTLHEIKTSLFTYNPDGSVATEVVTKGELSYTKTYVYDSSTGNITSVQIRKTT